MSKHNIFARYRHQLTAAFVTVALSAGMAVGHAETPHTRRDEEILEQGQELVEAGPSQRGTAHTYNLGALGTERNVSFSY